MKRKQKKSLGMRFLILMQFSISRKSFFRFQWNRKITPKRSNECEASFKFILEVQNDKNSGWAYWKSSGRTDLKRKANASFEFNTEKSLQLIGSSSVFSLFFPFICFLIGQGWMRERKQSEKMEKREKKKFMRTSNGK